MPPARHAIVIGVAAVLFGCPSAPPDPEPTPEPTPAPIGVDPTVAAGPGEVRGGVLPDSDADFPRATHGGIAAEARPGDFVLYNDRVRFVVRSQPGHGYVGIPGALIDADILRPEGQLGRDTLEEAFLTFGIGRIAGADTIELVADGSDGEAVVRVTGRDERWSFVEGVIEADDPITPDLGLQVVTDYVLAPDSWTLRVVTTLTNTGDEAARVNPLDGLIASQEELRPWGYGEGMDPGSDDAPASVGSVGRNGEATMLLYRPDGPLARFAANELLSSSGIELTAHGWQDIEAGQSVVLERHRVVAPDPATAEAARARAWGQSLELLSGTVSDSAGPVAGARVHVVDNTGFAGPRFLGFAVTDAKGSWRAEVPAGDYLVIPDGVGEDEIVDLPADAGRYGPFAHPGLNQRQLDVLDGTSTAVGLPRAAGHPLVAGTPLSTGETADLTLPDAGSLRVTLLSGGAPVAGTLAVVRNDPPPSPIDAALLPGLGLTQANATRRVWTADGDVTLAVPPGSYTVTAHASARHGIMSASMDVTEAGASMVLELSEEVPRDGWLAMDSHLHGAPSSDASLSMEERLIACAAAGIELPVTTDHDRQADYGPIATALGLDGAMHVVDGVEVSPVLRGHFNLFPVEPRGRAVVNGGAPPWWEPFDDTEALFARIRESAPEGALLQINHGRETSGMMSASNYDPTSGVPFREDFWSWGFDLVEIVNARGVGAWLEPRADWFSWLNLGQRKVPVGVSDSHGRTNPCGYGRTDVFVDSTDPGSVSSEAVREAVAAGHVVVAGGLSLRVTANGGALPGDEVTGATVALQISVAGPDWIVPEVVRVYRNGLLLVEEEIEGSGGGIWWQDTIEDSPDIDSWYVVEAEGSQPLGGPWGGAVPYALANAVFLDRDGDGWEPPGIPAPLR